MLVPAGVEGIRGWPIMMSVVRIGIEIEIEELRS
jgi:hypothetical protein